VLLDVEAPRLRYAAEVELALGEELDAFEMPARER
jgi:hypothetical protein